MNPSNRIAVCPGSYDPVTKGHLDVIARAAVLFDEVIVGVVNLPVRKGKTLFDADERCGFIEAATKHLENVRAQPFSNLVVDFARDSGARAIVKGLRAISDFEFEFQMALMNRKMQPTIETIFLMPKEECTYISSRIVKEIARLGGNVEAFVPDCVRVALAKKFAT